MNLGFSVGLAPGYVQDPTLTFVRSLCKCHLWPEVLPEHLF